MSTSDLNEQNLNLPESLHEKAKALAERECISVDQLIALALAEKNSALMTEEYLGARAKRGSAARFRKALAKVPAEKPKPRDRIRR